MLPTLLVLASLQCLAQPGASVRLNGTVVDARTEHPLVGTEVRVAGTQCVQITDRKGRFRFPTLPAGKTIIEASFVGYTTVRDSALLAPEITVDLDIRMDRHVIPIDPLVVTVRSQALEQLGFYARRENGNGAFLTRAQIEKMPALNVASDIVRNLTGLHVVHLPGLRGNRVVGRNSCPFRYVVDGISTDAAFDFDDMQWQWIEGLEVYRGLGEIPGQFAASGTGAGNARTCGVIVVWTRRKSSGS